LAKREGVGGRNFCQFVFERGRGGRGGGGNSAIPERNQKADSPAALLVKSRSQQKSFLFLLEEKKSARANQKM